MPSLCEIVVFITIEHRSGEVHASTYLYFGVCSASLVQPKPQESKIEHIIEVCYRQDHKTLLGRIIVNKKINKHPHF